MNAGCSRTLPTLRTPANEYAIAVAVERKPWRLPNIARELELYQQRVLIVLHDDQLYAYPLLAERTFASRPWSSYGYNFVNGYDINTERMSSFLIKFYGDKKYVLRVMMCLGPCHTQAVSLRLPTAAVLVRAQVGLCGIYGGPSGTGTDFLRVLRFPLPSLIPPTAPHLSSSIIPGWYNRPKQWPT
jgi:hypothetical protein